MHCSYDSTFPVLIIANVGSIIIIIILLQVSNSKSYAKRHNYSAYKEFLVCSIILGRTGYQTFLVLAVYFLQQRYFCTDSYDHFCCLFVLLCLIIFSA